MKKWLKNVKKCKIKLEYLESREHETNFKKNASHQHPNFNNQYIILFLFIKKNNNHNR